MDYHFKACERDRWMLHKNAQDCIQCPLETAHDKQGAIREPSKDNRSEKGDYVLQATAIGAQNPYQGYYSGIPSMAEEKRGDHTLPTSTSWSKTQALRKQTSKLQCWTEECGEPSQFELSARHKQASNKVNLTAMASVYPNQLNFLN